MKTVHYFLFILLISAISTKGQKPLQIGVSGGALLFSPQAQHLGHSLNNSMKNGAGWSAGIYIEEFRTNKLHPILKINYFNLKSDVFLQKVTGNPYAGDDYQNIIGDYKNTAFNQLAFSAGFRYYINHYFFVSPGVELFRALNKKTDINKTTYNVKLGAGADLEFAKIILEYAYGLQNQRTIYDSTIPFVSTHRNTYLQLKVHIPLVKF